MESTTDETPAARSLLSKHRAVDGDFSFAEHLAGTGLKLCFDFWRAQRRGAAVPRKSSIDPVEMPIVILPNLFIYEQTSPGTFRCRLAGTEICRATGRNPTGLYLHEQVAPAARESRTRLFTNVIERGKPVVYGGRMVDSPHTWLQFKRLLLPVARDGSRADTIFGMLVFPTIELSVSLAMNPTLDFVAWATGHDLAEASPAEPVARTRL
jgi:hypothetical protein